MLGYIGFVAEQAFLFKYLFASAVARRYLGDAFVDHYALTRAWEADQFDAAVTDWEVRRYLEQA